MGLIPLIIFSNKITKAYWAITMSQTLCCGLKGHHLVGWSPPPRMVEGINSPSSKATWKLWEAKNCKRFTPEVGLKHCPVEPRLIQFQCPAFLLSCWLTFSPRFPRLSQGPGSRRQPPHQEFPEMDSEGSAFRYHASKICIPNNSFVICFPTPALLFW